MKEVLAIFVSGVFILLIAIVLNFVAMQIGLGTWYSFLQGVNENGLVFTLKEEGIVSILFMFLIYPFVLGLVGWFALKKLGF